jgi:hypothetical protein
MGLATSASTAAPLPVAVEGFSMDPEPPLVAIVHELRSEFPDFEPLLEVLSGQSEGTLESAWDSLLRKALNES